MGSIDVIASHRLLILFFGMSCPFQYIHQARGIGMNNEIVIVSDSVHLLVQTLAAIINTLDLNLKY